MDMYIITETYFSDFSSFTTVQKNGYNSFEKAVSKLLESASSNSDGMMTINWYNSEAGIFEVVFTKYNKNLTELLNEGVIYDVKKIHINMEDRE